MSGLCECGCGTAIPPTDAKGRPRRFVHGHNPRKTVEATFWLYVDKSEGPDGCWHWTGAHTGRGYGQFRNRAAHNVAYELCVGPIPEGRELDHVRERGCAGRDCVNPAHLEPVTHAENIRRGYNGNQHTGQTHCKNGHEFTPENTRLSKSRAGGVVRNCRACHRDYMREWNAARR